jgi:hypothetical protein
LNTLHLVAGPLLLLATSIDLSQALSVLSTTSGRRYKSTSIAGVRLAGVHQLKRLFFLSINLVLKLLVVVASTTSASSSLVRVNAASEISNTPQSV